MEYKIISGPVTEIRRGWMPTKRGGQRVRRGTKAKKSSIEKMKRNETDAIKKLTRVLNCNFRMGDLWLTLTFPGKEEINWETAQTAFDRFLRKLRESYRKEQGANIKFVYSQGRKDEDGNDARPHFHLVMPAADYELVCALWPQEAVTYRRLDGRKDHVKIAEYMIRNAKGVPGKKKYHTSRGLEKPVYTEPVPVYINSKIELPKDAIICEQHKTRDYESGFASEYVRYIRPEKERKGNGARVSARSVKTNVGGKPLRQPPAATSPVRGGKGEEGGDAATSLCTREAKKEAKN